MGRGARGGLCRQPHPSRVPEEVRGPGSLPGVQLWVGGWGRGREGLAGVPGEVRSWGRVCSLSSNIMFPLRVPCELENEEMCSFLVLSLQLKLVCPPVRGAWELLNQEASLRLSPHGLRRAGAHLPVLPAPPSSPPASGPSADPSRAPLCAGPWGRGQVQSPGLP